MGSFTLYSDEGRLLYVAYLYDRLGRHLLHGVLSDVETWIDSKNFRRFDFDHDELNSYVEFKGSSNMDQLKLFEDQLDGQLEELGFPFDRGFVWIFSYRNRSGRDCLPRKRLLSVNASSPEQLARFVARNTNVSYAVDVRVLDAWRRLNGTRNYCRDKLNVRQILGITRTDLARIARDARSALSDLGFSEEIGRWLPPGARCIKPRTIETVLDGNQFRFKIIPILPNRFKADFLKRLNGYVRPL